MANGAFLAVSESIKYHFNFQCFMHGKEAFHREASEFLLSQNIYITFVVDESAEKTIWIFCSYENEN